MIFGTWKKVSGEWCIKIPKDAFWGSDTPISEDEVTVINRNGNFKEVILDCMCYGNDTSWIFYPFYQNISDRICYRPGGTDHDDYEYLGLDEDYGIFHD